MLSSFYNNDLMKDTGGQNLLAQSDPMVANAQEKKEQAEKLEILKRALVANIDVSHIKPKQTKYKFDIPTLALVLGMSGVGKTSYLLNMFIDAPHNEKHKCLIYVNNSLFPLDKIVVEYAKKHKNVLIITTESFDLRLGEYIIDMVKKYNKDPKNPVYTYICIDNMVFDINPDVLKMFIGSRHYHIMVFILIHVISSTNARALGTLRDLSTHYVIFKWLDLEKLKKLLSKEDIDAFVKNINNDKNTHKKMILDKYAQTKNYE